jgi:hypothetical protein
VHSTCALYSICLHYNLLTLLGRKSAGTASATEQMSTQNHLPALPPTYCDARSAMLDMSMWTTVPLPSNLAAAAISLYLQTDHPLLRFFDAVVFLEDLLEGRSRYCSTLLVSSLLFWALVSHLPKLIGRPTNNHDSMGLSHLTNGLGACRVVSVLNVSASGMHSETSTHYQRYQRHCF